MKVEKATDRYHRIDLRCAENVLMYVVVTSKNEASDCLRDHGLRKTRIAKPSV